MDVRSVTLEGRALACVRHVGGSSETAAGFDMLMAWAGPKGLLGPGTKTIGLYWDDPATTPEAELRSDACITVPAGTQGEGAIEIREMPEGDYAMALHVGPYDTVEETYAALMRFVTDRGAGFRDWPPMEIYLDGPDTPLEETRTEIYIAIE